MPPRDRISALCPEPICEVMAGLDRFPPADSTSSSSPATKKYFASVFRKDVLSSRCPVSARGALRDRHERWKRDAMDAPARETSEADADVKACGPDLPTLRSSRAVTSRVMTGAIKPGSRGERAISVKTVAQGGPDCSDHTCGSFPVLFIMHGGRGCGGHPAFPAPSANSRVRVCCITRGFARENDDAHPVLFDQLDKDARWRFMLRCRPGQARRQRVSACRSTVLPVKGVDRQ
jgi:hypothetical protein